MARKRERERERESDIYIYIHIYIYILAQGSRHEWFKAEPKKEGGMKPERGESKPTAAVL